MRFSVLSSGSKANCTFIEGGSTRILIDCGLSGAQTEKRLRALGVEPSTLSAIIITHEHSDHIYGVHTLSRRYKIPVYANEATSQFLGKMHAKENFITGEAFSIGDLHISPFSITHDAAEPVGFVIQSEGLKFGQATDLGKVTPLVRESLSHCNALVLESNHDPLMLQECSYTWQLKQRISSAHGHLSNHDAGTLLAELLHDGLLHVVLGHLSENSNTPEVAHKTVSDYLGQAPLNPLKSLVCACIAQQTRLFQVGDEAILELAAS
jgi:phosphoribosyl 1,2-cyclic phosphodiesterase